MTGQRALCRDPAGVHYYNSSEKCGNPPQTTSRGECSHPALKQKKLAGLWINSVIGVHCNLQQFFSFFSNMERNPGPIRHNKSVEVINQFSPGNGLFKQDRNGCFWKTLMVMWPLIIITICHATETWDSLHQQLESQYSLEVSHSAKTSTTYHLAFQLLEVFPLWEV